MEEKDRIKNAKSLHEPATIVMWGYDDFIVTGSRAALAWDMV